MGSGGSAQGVERLFESADVPAGELQQESVIRRRHHDDLDLDAARTPPRVVGLGLYDERVVGRLHDHHVHTPQDAGTRPSVVDQVLHVSQPSRDGDRLAPRLVLGEHGEVLVVQADLVWGGRALAQELLAEPPVGDGRHEEAEPHGHALQVPGVLVLEVGQPGGGVDDHQLELVRLATSLAVLDQVVAQQGAHGQSDDADGAVVGAVPGVVVDGPEDVVLAEPTVGRQVDHQQVAVVVEQFGDVDARPHLGGADAVDVDGQDVGLHASGGRAVRERERLHQPVSLVVGGALNE